MIYLINTFFSTTLCHRNEDALNLIIEKKLLVFKLLVQLTGTLNEMVIINQVILLFRLQNYKY